MVISFQIFNVHISRSDIIHSSGCPSALDTILGWVLCGVTSQLNPLPAVSWTVTLTLLFDNLLRKYWIAEESSAPTLSITEYQLAKLYII